MLWRHAAKLSMYADHPCLADTKLNGAGMDICPFCVVNMANPTFPCVFERYHVSGIRNSDACSPLPPNASPNLTDLIDEGLPLRCTSLFRQFNVLNITFCNSSRSHIALSPNKNL